MGSVDEKLLATHMARLSMELDICEPVVAGKFLLLDYPVHGNVGDLLIWHGEREFFRRHGKKPLGQYSINNIGWRARRLLEECSTICFHGGGNFGDLWPWYQKKREEIIQQYPQKRIVIFPQTVHFDNLEELDTACAIFKAHPDLHMFLRDRHSFSLLNCRGVPNIRLCPDMAHALWGMLSAPKPTQSVPLYLLRRDKEAGGLSLDISAKRDSSIDWDDLLTAWTARAYRIGFKTSHRDGWRRLNNRLPAHTIWNLVSTLLIRRAINLFAQYETVVTNRLHAMILAVLLGRKVVVFDNSYGKISSYTDLWMRDIPTIDFRWPAGLSVNRASP